MNAREQGIKKLVRLTPAILVVEKVRPEAPWMRKLPDEDYGIVYHTGHVTVTQEWATFRSFATAETREVTMAHFYDSTNDYAVHIRDVHPGIIYHSDTLHEVSTGLLPGANVEEKYLHSVGERLGPHGIETVQKPWEVYTQLLGLEGLVYKADTTQFAYALDVVVRANE